MQYLKTYLKTITDRGNPKLAESISKTAEAVGSQHLKNFSFCSHEIGLVWQCPVRKNRADVWNYVQGG